MSEDKKNIKEKIDRLEAEMTNPHFWDDKARAQAVIRDMQTLKDELAGLSKYDKGPAVITIFSGAGGDDAEDFSRMLFDMYLKYTDRQGWNISILHEHKTDHGGYRNITFEIDGKYAYGILKNESGVHRLVRISPFSARKARHTSFSMVEVVPKFESGDEADIVLLDADLKIEFARSSGPGGQNVNKRDTAVRIVHIPTNLSVHVESERTQERNRERAMSLLKAKIFKKQEEERKATERGMHISSTTDIEWGNQIRSYVLHPYKMIKDHRTDVEVKDTESVLEDGELEPFLEAEKDL